MNAKTKAIVSKATVRITKRGGLGVFVPGGLILTAAHCINFSCGGRMSSALASSGEFTEDVKTSIGECKAEPVAVEPCSDLAALCSVDGQIAPVDASAFDAICEAIQPVPVCRKHHKVGDRFPIYVRAHTGKWISGKAVLACGNSPSLFLETESRILGGTSGGPIVNASGELVGIVSSSEDSAKSAKMFTGSGAYVALALPVWIRRRIFDDGI